MGKGEIILGKYITYWLGEKAAVEMKVLLHRDVEFH